MWQPDGGHNHHQLKHPNKHNPTADHHSRPRYAQLRYRTRSARLLSKQNKTTHTPQSADETEQTTSHNKPTTNNHAKHKTPHTKPHTPPAATERSEGGSKKQNPHPDKPAKQTK